MLEMDVFGIMGFMFGMMGFAIAINNSAQLSKLKKEIDEPKEKKDSFEKMAATIKELKNRKE
jgi:hypothetical protein